MVETWAAVVLTLGAAVIGAATGLASTLLHHRHERALRRADEAKARRERAAEVLGPVRRFLIDINPTRQGLNFGPESVERYNELRARWDDLHDQLLIVRGAAVPRGLRPVDEALDRRDQRDHRHRMGPG